MQDGHYHSREGCDQDHNKLCGELVTDYYELVTLLIIPNWSLLPDLSCPIPMVTSQRKFLIGAIMTTMIIAMITITTRQKEYCIGVNTSQVPQPTCFWTFKAVGEPD